MGAPGKNIGGKISKINDTIIFSSKMINYRHFWAFSCLTLVRTNITSDDGEEGVASLHMVITRSRYIYTHMYKSVLITDQVARDLCLRCYVILSGLFVLHVSFVTLNYIFLLIDYVLHLWCLELCLYQKVCLYRLQCQWQKSLLLSLF
jgi:hypothetical protein